MKKLNTVATLGVAAALLTACGGGNDDGRAKAPSVSATNGATASQSPTQESTASKSATPTSSSASATESKSASATSKASSAPSKGSNTSSAATPSKSASPTTKASASTTVKPIAKEDTGTSNCSILPTTSTKSPSFTLKGAKAQVSKDSSDVTFTFSKDFSEKLFVDEAGKTKAKEYGFRLVNSNGDNLIYSFKSHKAFLMKSTGADAGKQHEVPSVKVSVDGKNLKVTTPQKEFPFTKKAWGAEEFFYADTGKIFLSSCEKRNV